MTNKWDKEKIRQIVYDNIKEIAVRRADLFESSLYVGVRIYPDYSFNIYIGASYITDDYDNENFFLLKFPMYAMVYDFLYDIIDGKPYDLTIPKEITFKYAFDKVFGNILSDTHKILNDELENWNGRTIK